jgi:hypothetical protein
MLNVPLVTTKEPGKSRSRSQAPAPGFPIQNPKSKIQNAKGTSGHNQRAGKKPLPFTGPCAWFSNPKSKIENPK